MKEFILSGNAGGMRKIDFAAELNDEQRAVVEAGDGPTLVLAGAGSGKTRTITYRVAWLLAQGVPAERILLLTFTNKAAREMTTRIESLLGHFPHGLWAGTFHSIANRLLRQYGFREGFAANFSILDDEDAGDLMKLCTAQQKVNANGQRFPSPNVLKGLLSYARNATKPVADVLNNRYPHFVVFKDDILRIFNAYEKQKREANVMDFDDLLTVLLALLQNHSDVRATLSEQFAYVFVDEFQDTNIVQAQIVHALSSTHRNIFVVGDDAQSIYSFRAAEIRNMLDFSRTYPDAQMYRLVTNYRSTPQILAVANAVIAHNEEQFPKELRSVLADGERPALVPANSASQEAQYVVERMTELLDAGAAPRTIAVLFRAAFHSQQVEFELMRRGIAYEYRGGMKFFERAHIKDALAHLRVLANVKDLVAWMRLLRLQIGIGEATAARIAAQLTGYVDAASALASPFVTGATKVAAGAESARRILVAIESTKNPSDALRAFAASDYEDYLEAEYPNARERLDDIEQLAVFAEQFADAATFLDAIALDTEDDKKKNSNMNEEKIILSTIHQAKGLEWDTVFIIHLAEGMFPSSRSREEANGIEEERRLFYVAATRARQRLVLSYPITSGFEHVELRQQSQFLSEIPKNLIEEVRLRYAGFASPTVPLPTRRSWYAAPDDEPTIVLDDSGERITKQSPVSFLRDINDL